MPELTPKMRLVQAYIDLAASAGIPQITLQKVAKHAKVPFSTAHYHFGNSAGALLAAAMAEISERARAHTLQRMEHHRSRGTSAIDAYLHATFDWIQDRKAESTLWLFSYYLSAVDADANAIQAETLALAKKRVLSLLRESVGSGELKLRIPPSAALASHVHAVLFGLGIQAMSSGKPRVQKLLRAECIASVKDRLKVAG